jgi:hypothetical protein
MLDGVSILQLTQLQEITGPHCNPYLTIAVSGTLAAKTLNFAVTDISGGLPHDRVLSTIDYLRHLHHALPNQVKVHDRPVDFVFQAEDVPVNIPSVSWETRRSWDQIILVPDLYYFTSQGYEDAFIGTTPWNMRQNKIIWRGSTTGLFYQRLEDIDQLPRYQLCVGVSGLGDIADVGLNAVVQALDSEQEALIHERLTRENLFKPFIPMHDMAQYRYTLDIDGNSNSWNFIMKLRLGCCVLRVESEWQQWFWPRLSPWVHYVPLARDLSNIGEIVEWCLSHEAECEEISRQGMEFAQTMRFSDEMRIAASNIFTS